MTVKGNFFVRTGCLAVRMMTALIPVLILAGVFTAEDAEASGKKCEGHWRDFAYDVKIMQRYKPYSHCVKWTASQFELPEELLYSILYVERGDVSGKCMTNNNGTEDCGPAQINDVRLGEIKKFDLDKSDMKNSPCRNIWVMGYLIRREIEKADGDLWLGVGNYHYKRSVNSEIHDRYVGRIRDAWVKLNSNVADICR